MPLWFYLMESKHGVFERRSKEKMQSMKETAANVAASAKSGLEKTKATVEEKMEKATCHDQKQKDMATEKKQERIHQVELDKQEAQMHNAAGKNLGEGVHSYSTTGEHGQSTGGGQKSALPGHGSGQPTGRVVEGTAASHPFGLNPGWGGTASHNTLVEGNPHGYGTGETYS